MVTSRGVTYARRSVHLNHLLKVSVVLQNYRSAVSIYPKLCDFLISKTLFCGHASVTVRLREFCKFICHPTPWTLSHPPPRPLPHHEGPQTWDTKVDDFDMKLIDMNAKLTGMDSKLGIIDSQLSNIKMWSEMSRYWQLSCQGGSVTPYEAVPNKLEDGTVERSPTALQSALKTETLKSKAVIEGLECDQLKNWANFCGIPHSLPRKDQLRLLSRKIRCMEPGLIMVHLGVRMHLPVVSFSNTFQPKNTQIVVPTM
ncbi:hypothetical protein Moror_3988 [Moniliophthora roreri MCA 2997]|uniref:Uncharacterized protein n=1 Tax=Moniliophthora roreri (strain MCA 2997) TaxID=1381753 RepID=V2XRS3_MONRO|nr:hypothetical protein Moror_3988 [Moniliophthora roreri MCA 2997]